MPRHLQRGRAIAISVLVLALLAAACTGSESSTTSTTSVAETSSSTTTTPAPTTAPGETTTTTEGPKKPVGGSAVLGQPEEPPTLNPYAVGGNRSVVSFIGNAYFTGVQRIDGNTLELIPDVVVDLPTTNNGGLVVNEDGTMTVHYDIHPDAVWEDGTPISGDDFRFTYDIIMDPDLPIANGIYEDIVPESIEVGPKTFEYTMTAPTVQVEFLFSVLIPKHSVEGSDFVTDWNDTMWASGGPFIFSEWLRGESLTVVRNDNYWKRDAETAQPLPLLDEVVFRFIPETDSLVGAFRDRDVHAINPPADVDLINSLKALESEGAQVEVLSGPLWEHLNFQFGPGRLQRNETTCNNNLNLRKAVAHAVDKQTIVDLLVDGQVDPLESYVSAYRPSLSGDAWARYPYDPSLASELYLEAVAETGTQCSVVFTAANNEQARVQLAELLSTMFDDAGIPYEHELEAREPFWGSTVPTGTWDVGEWAWLGSPGLAGLIQAHDFFDPQSPPPEGKNLYRWGTEESSVIDAATERFAVVRDEMNATVDEAELTALIAEAEKILADNVVIIPLYARLDSSAVWADEVAGYKHNPSQAQDTWNIEEWFRADR